MPARPPRRSPDARKPRRADRPAEGASASGYTTREVAEVLGLPTSRILSWTRRGLIEPRRGSNGAYVFSFQDIALLRAARALTEADIPPRRVLASLDALRGQLPVGRPLSAVTISALGDRVLVQDDDATWEPDSGQLTLTFPAEAPSRRIPSIAVVPDSGGSDASSAPSVPGPDDSVVRSSPVDISPAGRRSMTADDWYDAGVDLEADDTLRALEAYRSALALDPTLSDAHLNLGRLLHESGDLTGAREAYLAAVECDESNARAHFNLGVSLEDDGSENDAVEAYRKAVELEPQLAVAHFNLARLLEKLGEPTAAIHHLQEYRKLATLR